MTSCSSATAASTAPSGSTAPRSRRRSSAPTDFLGAEVLPRLHAGVPRLRRAAPGGRRRSRRLHAARAGRRSRGRPPGARLQADRPGQRERRHAPRDDLRLALPAQHPPLGDDRRQPARALPLEPEGDRRADRPLLAPLRPGRELQQRGPTISPPRCARRPRTCPSRFVGPADLDGTTRGSPPSTG